MAEKKTKPAQAEPEKKQPTPEEMLRAKISACQDEINAVLAKHGCKIVAYRADTQPVGNGSAEIHSYACGIFPDQT